MRYISHKAVYTILPTTLQQMPNSLLDNYIIQAVRQIKIRPLYENKLTMVRVKNGVAELPSDFIKTYGVYYNSKEPTTEEFESLIGCIAEGEDVGCLSDSPLTSSSDAEETPTTTVVDDSLEDRYKLVKLSTLDSNGNPTTEWIFKQVAFNEYMASSYAQNCWKQLKHTDDLFTQCFIDKPSIDLTSDCPYRYRFDKCNHILTSLPNGWLKIAYVGRAVDEFGDYLIPDDMDFMQVVKDGVMMVYWEERLTNHKEYAFRNYREYQDKFRLGVARLRGTSFLPKGVLQERKLRNIIYDDIKIANNYQLTGNPGYRGGSLYSHLNV